MLSFLTLAGGVPPGEDQCVSTATHPTSSPTATDTSAPGGGTSTHHGGHLSMAQGVALYVGAVVGTGVIAMPALAARVAGPASLLAWGALVLASIPLAATFATLGARHPDAGGVSTYARQAFGPRAAALVGWWFYTAVPVGSPAAALFAGAYVASAFGGGQATVWGTGLAMLVAVAAANYLGLRFSGRVQLAFAGVLVTLLVVAAAASLPHARWSNLHPFVPHGWWAVGSAAGLLVWSFAGWEAVTHLAAEFRHPARDLPRATATAVVVVGGVYLAIAAATVLVLGAAAGDSDAPLADLLDRGLGGPVKGIAALVAVLLTFGTMNSYYAGAAKLGAALGRDGALPGWLARGSRAGEVPRRSLTVIVAGGVVSFALVGFAGVGPEPLVLAVTGSFAAVYAAGTAAAVWLLPRRTAGWWTAVVACGIVLVLLATTGWYLLWPVAVSVVALLYLRRSPTTGRARISSSATGG